MDLDHEQLYRHARAALIAAVVEEAGHLGVGCDERRLQKYIYLLQEGMEIPFGYTYRMPKRAPKSTTLEQDLVRLEVDGILSLEVSREEPGTRYVVKGPGNAFQERHSGIAEAAREPIRSLLSALEDRSLRDLEVITRALFEREPPTDVPQEPAQDPHPEGSQRGVAIEDLDLLIAESDSPLGVGVAE